MAELDDLQLHHQAMLAIKGLSDEPERTVARLLRASAELSGDFRSALADALEGTGGPITLSFKGTSSKRRARAIRQWKARIQCGRAVDQKMTDGLGYEVALRTVATESKRGRKSVEADLTLSRRARKWSERRAGVGMAFNPQVKEQVFAMVLADLGRSADETTLFAAADQMFDFVIEESDRQTQLWKGNNQTL